MPIVYEHSTMSLLDVFLGIVFLSLKLDTTFFFKFNKKFKARQWKFFVFFLILNHDWWSRKHNFLTWLRINKSKDEFALMV